MRTFLTDAKFLKVEEKLQFGKIHRQNWSNSMTDHKIP